MRQPCLRESLYLTKKYDLSIESTYEWTSQYCLHQYKVPGRFIGNVWERLRVVLSTEKPHGRFLLKL